MEQEQFFDVAGIVIGNGAHSFVTNPDVSDRPRP